MAKQKVNERWRAALAFLVVALAAPFLVISAAGSAEGIGPGDDGQVITDDAGVDTAQSATGAPSSGTANASAPVEYRQTIQEVEPDFEALSALASAWVTARAEVAKDGGLILERQSAPPSVANLSLLPVVILPEAPDPESPEEPGDDAASPDDAGSQGPESEPPESPQPGDDAGAPEDPASVPPEAPQPDEGDLAPEPPETLIPAPLQVNGRVPPPPGGPTAEQWDALRRCESTHNYQAVSPTGKFRGAYQFSQQTWDWVAGTYQPHLVGVDPIDAAPGWQDVMAYTLYALRGWDQWPECGVYLF